MKKIIILYISLICFTSVVLAGDSKTANTESDIELWEAFSADFKPIKNLKVYVERQFRYYQKLARMKSHFTEIGVRYRSIKWLGFRINYRFISRVGEKRHRFDANVLQYFKLNSFQISNRTRLQKEFIENKDSETLFRNRLRVTFSRSKKILPFVGGEIFLGLADDKDQNQFRLTVGADWKMKKRFVIRVLYHYQKDLVKEKSELTHIFKLRFRYSF